MTQTRPISAEQVEAAARAVATKHYSLRFVLPVDNHQVIANVNSNWQIFSDDARIALNAAASIPASDANEDGNPLGLLSPAPRVIGKITPVPASRGVETISLNPFEIQSGLDRVRHAELLIRQLADNHDGRNTWLMNYGHGEDVEKMRDVHPTYRRDEQAGKPSKKVDRPANFAGWKDQLLSIQSLLPDEDPQNQEAVLSIVEEMLEGFDDVIETETILASPDPQPVQEQEPVAFEDVNVQAVYALLCDDTKPPEGEHWEGFVARRIVSALASPSEQELTAKVEAAEQGHAAARANFLTMQGAAATLAAKVERLEEDLRISDIEGTHAFALAVDDPGKNPPVLWRDRAEAAEAKVERLTEALKPFAAEADSWHPEQPDATGVYTSKAALGDVPAFTIGDLRAARTALGDEP